ncbi:hypothetical protein C8A05DRAFT_19320 [Staphylotrichum tortipilum]|uniref:Uncharacterized protein n=1 Tax=Staphylotrichum tortipilum TaxID=2831512 RepID=A0AAN6RPU0_9PEZI|nr:hypothetical protein C8A05DRAFT_19320 [Staphylotrichum longicolle]
MRSPGDIVALLLAVAISSCWAQNQCFYPNGARATNDFPCDPEAADSSCCGGGMGTVCLSNKLCSGPDGNIIRGSCTNKDWNSSGCPLFCLTAMTGGTDLVSCSNVTRTDTSYCCDGGRPFCCDDGVARFEVLPSRPQTVARWDAKASQFVVVQEQTSSSGASATSSQTSSTATSTFGSVTSSSTESSGSQTSPPRAPDSSAAQSGGLSSAAQAGIGVGAGVLALALGAVAYLLFKLRSKKARLAELERQQGVLQDYGAGSSAGENKPDFARHRYAAMIPAEIEAMTPRHEIDSRTARFELDSEWRPQLS